MERKGSPQSNYFGYIAIYQDVAGAITSALKQYLQHVSYIFTITGVIVVLRLAISSVSKRKQTDAVSTARQLVRNMKGK